MRRRTGLAVHDASTPSRPRKASTTALLARGAAALGAIVFVLAAVQPPAPAGPGLDQSWRIALTMATLQHLRFGHDIVFTYGPLGYVLQGVPSPELARSTAYVMLALAAIAVWGVWSACSGRSSPFFRAALLLALWVVLASVTVDYAIFAGTLGLLARVSRSPRWSAYAAPALGAVAAFGLLSKQTLGLDVIASAGTFWLVQLVQGPRRRRTGALIAIAGAAVVGTAVMLIAFHSVPNVVEYLAKSSAVVGGFSEAMSLTGPASVTAGALAIFAIVAVAACTLVRGGHAAFAGAVMVALFLAWKHGFVREDGHVIYFFVVAGILAPLIGIVGRGRIVVPGAAAATLAAFCGLGYVVTTYGVNLVATLHPDKLFADASYLLDPVDAARRGVAATDAALQADRLPDAARGLLRTGSVDVITAETGIIRANGLQWHPLPVFQSYTAYTPALDVLNANALRADPPRFELFRFEDIDLRYPLSAEPATFAALLCDYRLRPESAATKSNGLFMLLERDTAQRCTESPAGDRIAAALNATIPVPRVERAGDVIRAWPDLRLGIAGKAVSALWRPPIVNLEATYRNGTTAYWRLVPATAGDGVIISPMPRGQDDARRLVAGEAIPEDEVASIRVITRAPFYRLDSVRFTVLHR